MVWAGCWLDLILNRLLFLGSQMFNLNFVPRILAINTDLSNLSKMENINIDFCSSYFRKLNLACYISVRSSSATSLSPSSSVWLRDWSQPWCSRIPGVTPQQSSPLYLNPVQRPRRCQVVVSAMLKPQLHLVGSSSLPSLSALDLCLLSQAALDLCLPSQPTFGKTTDLHTPRSEIASRSVCPSAHLPCQTA